MTKLQREKSNTKARLGFSLTSLFFIFLTLLNPVYADDVDLSTIPEKLGSSLGIGTFAGGILASSILFNMLVLPIAVIARGKRMGGIPELASTLIWMGLCIAIGWLPYWFLLILSLIIALMYAGKVRDLVTGGAK